MRFLIDTLSERRRRMEWEDLLLMAARCLLIALAALAVSRPFVPPDSPTPWSFVMPAVLLGVGLFGGSFVLSTAKKRLLILGTALLLLFLAAGMVLMQHWLNLKRFETGGRRDVALIIDASTSMTRSSGSRTLFDEALNEARRIVKEAPRGTSFAIILGGPSPQALSNTPVSHRADVLAQLDGLQAVGGTFRAHDALGMATLILAEGERPNKDIIVLTDSQRHGSRFENAGAWKSLDDAWKTLPAKPRLMIRGFPHPLSLRNAGIASLTTARELTGTDRPSLLRTEIINTGNQAVTSGEVLIEIDGKQIAREPLGLLVPGQTQSIETRHRFTNAGPHVVTARLAGRDEIPGDDRADHVVMVRKAVRVVLVDGNSSGGFFERAAGHTALALAPAVSLIRGGEAGKDFLMDPVVIPAPEISSEKLADADVVILADVSRLPAAIAATLADRTAAGAGLVVLAGPRVDPAFYNAWDGPDGRVLPIDLGTEATDEKGISPAPTTFRHESLAWAADERRSDLGNALIRRWRKSNVTSGNGSLAAAFGNGDPFLTTRGYGRGRCVVASCAFDGRLGNLPARAAFVPLVHELVSWAAGGGVDWNLDSGWSPSVVLDLRSSGGLSATYSRKDGNKQKALLDRVDPTIDFNWENEGPTNKLPRENFNVMWKATLIPSIDGEYIFDVEVDDSMVVRINGNTVLEASKREEAKGARVRLQAGKPVNFEATYQEESGLAYVRLFWTPPGGTRHVIPSSAFIPTNHETSISYEAIDPQAKAAALEKQAEQARQLAEEAREQAAGQEALQQLAQDPAAAEKTLTEQLAAEQSEIAAEAKEQLAEASERQDNATANALPEAVQSTGQAAKEMAEENAQAAAETAQQAAAQLKEAAEAAKQDPSDQTDPSNQSNPAAQAQAAADLTDLAARQQDLSEALAAMAEGKPGPPNGKPGPPGNAPTEEFRTRATDPGVPPELAKLGISAEDWEKIKASLKSDVAGSSAIALPEEYRELVRGYFEQMSKANTP